MHCIQNIDTQIDMYTNYSGYTHTFPMTFMHAFDKLNPSLESH